VKKIYVFTWPKCKGCNTLKGMLSEQLIPFIEINTLAAENKKLWNDIKNQTGSEAVPMVLIQEDNTNEGFAYIGNKDWFTIEELIEIIKNNI